MNVEPPQRGFKTFVVLMLLGVSAFIISRGVGYTIQRVSQAEVTQRPENVKVTNISPDSVTITWLTKVATSEYVLYGPTQSLGFSEVTDRDSTTHHIDLPDLSPNTTYFYKIGVGRKSYDNEGTLYQFTTAPRVGSGVSYKAYGQILSMGGTPTKDAIVYFVVKDNDNTGSTGISTPLSSITSSNGIFSIDLKDAKVNDLSSPFYFSKSGDLVEIDVRGQNGEKASVLLKTDQLQPTPTIRLSLKGRLQDLTGRGPSSGDDIVLPKAPKKKKQETNPIRQLWEKILRK